MNLHVGPVLHLEFSRDFPVLCSTGIDGAVFTMNVPIDHPGKVPPPGHTYELVKKGKYAQIQAIADSQTTWHESYQREPNSLSLVDGEAYKTVQRNAIGDLRRRIQDIVSKNENASPAETLGRGDIVVDLVGQQRLLNACQNRATEIQLKLKDEELSSTSQVMELRRIFVMSLRFRTTRLFGLSAFHGI